MLSGGLDSTLAVKVMLEQGIELEIVNFTSPFCLCQRKKDYQHISQMAARNFGLPVKIISFKEDYLEVVKKPKYGYGKNVNPCIDCRIFMCKKAKIYMNEVKAKFIITGEVLNQRPMSQYKRALMIIEKESGLEGLILRPLSGSLLPETIPEKEGWVDRSKLLSIEGRSRKPQINLVKKFQIDDYASAAGGCLLTESGYARRIKDLIKHDELNLEQIQLIKLGRCFRFDSGAKVIVGRNESDNNRLLKFSDSQNVYFAPTKINGPSAIGTGVFRKDEILKAAAIIARYSDNPNDETVEVLYKFKNNENVITTKSICQSMLENLRV